jgi:hypothetical protein
VLYRQRNAPKRQDNDGAALGSPNDVPLVL